MTRRRASRLAAALLVAAGALAGCTGVPNSSAPRTVESIDIANRGGDTAQGGPAPGADARTVVRGFLDANAVDPVDHDTARKYLSPARRADWSDRTATIIGNDESVSTVQNGVVTVSGRLIGSLNQNGVYVPQLQGIGDGGGVQTFSYRIGISDGQNRIDELPPGLLLTAAQFAQTYTLHGVYFFDQSRRYLVPDARWSALEGNQLYSWLAGQLANGPRPDLSTSLTNDTLPSQANARRIAASGVAPIKVEIPGAAQLDSDGRQMLAAQIGATISDPSSDETIELTDGGSPVPLPGGTTEFTARAATAPYIAKPPAPDVYFLRGGQIARISGLVDTRLRNSPFFLNSIAVAGSTTAGSTTAGLTVAGVTGTGPSSTLVLGTTAAGYRETTVRGLLSRPAWLPSPPPDTTAAPEVWIGSGGTLLRVVVTGNRAVASTVTVNAGASGGRIVALRLSPDGLRIALVIEAVNRTRRLFIGSVVRSAGQVRIDALPVISPEGVTIDDAGWIGSQKLIAIGSITGSGDPRIFETNVDGSLWTGRAIGSILPAQPDSLTVAVSQLAWVSTNGTVWQQAGRSWSSPGPSDQTTGTAPVYLE